MGDLFDWTNSMVAVDRQTFRYHSPLPQASEAEADKAELNSRWDKSFSSRVMSTC